MPPLAAANDDRWASRRLRDDVLALGEAEERRIFEQPVSVSADFADVQLAVWSAAAQLTQHGDLRFVRFDALRHAFKGGEAPSPIHLEILAPIGILFASLTIGK